MEKFDILMGVGIEEKLQMGKDVVKVCIILPSRTILMKEIGNKV